METATSSLIKRRYDEAAKARALQHLLHRLKKFVRVYARDEHNHPLPDHVVEWASEFDDNPESIIHEAMSEFPAIWLDSLPESVCIVPVVELKKLAGTDRAEFLSRAGVQLVESEGARRRYQRMGSA